MKITPILALLTTIFIFVLTSSAQDNGRSSATWQVTKYAINATLPADASVRSIDLKATLNVRNVSGKPATTLTMRIAPNANVSTVEINGAQVDSSKSEEKINASSNLQRIATRFPSLAAGGELTVVVTYKLTLKDNSPLASLTPNGAQMMPLSYWYPTPNSWYFAGGADAAPFSVRVNAPSGQTMISSGSIGQGSSDSKLAGQPFFITGTWVESDKNLVSVLLPKSSGPSGQQRASELAELYSEAVAYISGVFGTPSTVPLRLVAVKRGAGFSGGGTVFVDEAVFRRPKVDSQTAMQLAEGAAKIWLGGMISVSGNGSGVITEGLSRYLATQFVEAKFGKDVADVERLRQRTAYAAVSRRDAPMGNVSPLEDYYFPVVANKGAMVWRLLAKRVGLSEFAATLRTNTRSGELSLSELRAAFASQKPLLDYFFDAVTDMNLMIGLPQPAGAETKVALRNTGGTDATVDVEATTATGEKIAAQSTIKAESFGEVIFKTPAKIVRLQVDVDKMYPQTDYSDDVAPRESTESDPLLAVKREFDKQNFAAAERTARTLLRDVPRSDELRTYLGRALLAQNKNAEAETEFKAVLGEKLPTARSMAWANVGLGEIASRAGRKEDALKFAEAAIQADADYGANLAARNLRTQLGIATPVDESIKSFFAAFDKAATSNRKAEVDALIMPGEVTRFAGGLSGSTEQWQTSVKHVDMLDDNTALVEADVSIKLLTREPESGMAVFRLVRSNDNWKLTGVDIFEVK